MKKSKKIRVLRLSAVAVLILVVAAVLTVHYLNMTRSEIEIKIKFNKLRPEIQNEIIDIMELSLSSDDSIKSISKIIKWGSTKKYVIEIKTKDADSFINNNTCLTEYLIEDEFRTDDFIYYTKKNKVFIIIPNKRYPYEYEHNDRTLYANKAVSTLNLIFEYYSDI